MLLAAYDKPKSCLGQYLDVRAEYLPPDLHNPDASPFKEVREVVIWKSALHSLPGSSRRDRSGRRRLVQALEKKRSPWGIALQLRDDDLGVFGDPELTRAANPLGDDREGKRTMLLSLVVKNASSVAEREILAGVLGDERTPTISRRPPRSSPHGPRRS